MGKFQSKTGYCMTTKNNKILSRKKTELKILINGIGKAKVPLLIFERNRTQ
jgi:hypothetical protein